MSGFVIQAAAGAGTQPLRPAVRGQPGQASRAEVLPDATAGADSPITAISTLNPSTAWCSARSSSIHAERADPRRPGNGTRDRPAGRCRTGLDGRSSSRLHARTRGAPTSWRRCCAPAGELRPDRGLAEPGVAALLEGRHDAALLPAASALVPGPADPRPWLHGQRGLRLDPAGRCAGRPARWPSRPASSSSSRSRTRDQPNPPVLTCADLQPNRDYYVLFTTSAGLYRYDINDVIRVVDFYRDVPLIEFVRKGRGMTSLTGEKLAEQQVTGGDDDGHRGARLDAGDPPLRGRSGVRTPAALRLLPGARPRHQRRRELQALPRAWITPLCEENVEYEAKRESLRLGPPLLRIVAPGTFDAYRQERVSGGAPEAQVKVPHLTPDRDFGKQFTVIREIEQVATMNLETALRTAPAVLRRLNDRQRSRIADLMTIRRFDTGTMILHQGTSAVALYLMLDGEVEVSREPEEGGRPVIAGDAEARRRVRRDGRPGRRHALVVDHGAGAVALRAALALGADPGATPPAGPGDRADPGASRGASASWTSGWRCSIAARPRRQAPTEQRETPSRSSEFEVEQRGASNSKLPTRIRDEHT